MKINLEISGARIIITTLIALVIIGIATGSAHPTTIPNPGHSLLSLGDPNYAFVEETLFGREFLTLELPTDITNYLGRLEIRPGSIGEGLLIRQARSAGNSALFLRTYSDHAQLDFFDGTGSSVANPLSLYSDKLLVPTGTELCLGTTSSADCITSFSSVRGSQIKFVDLDSDLKSGTRNFSFDPAYVLIISSGWGDADSSWVAFQGDMAKVFRGDYGSQGATITITLQNNTLDYQYAGDYSPRVVFIAYE